MKILTINSDGTIIGGGAVVYIEGNRLLKERGHSVAWLTVGDAPVARELKQLEFCLPEFRKGGILYKKIGLALGHLYNHKAYRMAEQAIREFKPDVVHVHTIQGHLSTSVLLPLKNAGIPIVQTLHDYRLLCPAIHFLSKGQPCEACKGKKYYHCILKRCRKNELFRSGVAMLGSYVCDYHYRYDSLISAYIAPGEFMRQKMIEFGYSPKKIITLPNAYFGKFPATNNLPRDHFLYAGRLSPEKGIDLLVRAAKELSVTVNIAGDGPERGHLEKLAQNIGAENVHFWGFQERKQLNDLYQTALALILPSRWYENGPLVLLESFANATPAVGARIGALPEFIEEGQTGLLFTPNDSMDLSRVLQNALAHPEHLREMGEFALKRVQVQYSPAIYIAGLEAILKERLA